MRVVGGGEMKQKGYPQSCDNYDAIKCKVWIPSCRWSIEIIMYPDILQETGRLSSLTPPCIKYNNKCKMQYWLMELDRFELSTDSCSAVPRRWSISINESTGLERSTLQYTRWSCTGISVGIYSTLPASLSGTVLQTLPELVAPLKGHSLSPRSCPLTLSAPSERFGY